MVSRIIKRDGRTVKFEAGLIKKAIKKAMIERDKFSEKKLEKVLDYVLKTIEKNFREKTPHVEEVQDIVELALMKYDLYDVAKAYILYRKERERVREEKKKILNKDHVDQIDKNFSLDAIRVLASRYLKKNEEGEVIESLEDLFQRVALTIAIPDLLYDPRVFSKKRVKKQKKEKFDPEKHEEKFFMKIGRKKAYFNKYHLERMKQLYDNLNSRGGMKFSWSEFLDRLSSQKFREQNNSLSEYFDVMVEQKFLPNSPTLYNAGMRLGQLSACFVLEIKDDMESIMNAVTEGAIIFKSGGGIGINYSELRPSGDLVASTSGVASGPTSFMRIMEVMTDVVKQGGKRRGANMGIMESWHPDISKFIRLKESDKDFSNFNLSVMFDKKFWEAHKNGESYQLVNPRNNKPVDQIEPNSLLNEIAYLAWENADPGVLFRDMINKRNVMKNPLGNITATNPCGEEPLYPYESCNLGSINLYKFVKNGEVDWGELEKCIRIGTRFLDNVIDINKYPMAEIEQNTKKTRKIGFGFMGLADALFAMDIRYNSEQGFESMRSFTEFLTYYSMDESVERAMQRGPFPLYSKSSYASGEMPMEGFYQKDLWTMDWKKLSGKIKKYGIRNTETTTMPPTGSISMIADTSSGIEPQFSLVYEKVVPVGSFYTIDWEFKERIKKWGMSSEKFLKRAIENGGSIQGLEEFPEELKNVFVTAHDIPWWDHIRAQAEISKWVSAATSKTINMPGWVKPGDVKRAYVMAHKMGCKGVTIYRDGSKSEQVIYLPESDNHENSFSSDNKTIDIMEKMGIEKDDGLELEKTEEGIREKNGEKCPSCNNSILKHESGCISCPSCGWSKCTIS